MKYGHLTDADIIDFLSGITDKKTEQEITFHLSSCETCRRDFEDFSKCLSPDENLEVPGTHIKNAILSMAKEREITVRKTPFFLFPIISAAAVIVFSLAGYLVFMNPFSVKEDSLEASLSTISGIVNLNGRISDKTNIISEMSSIDTASDASALITYRNGLQILIGSSSRVKLSPAGAEKKTSVELFSGSIIAKSSHFTGYDIISGEYIFAPSGTEFFVTTRGETVYAGVSQGSIIVSRRLTDEKVIIKTSFLWNSKTNEHISCIPDRLLLKDVPRIISENEHRSDSRSSATDTPVPENKTDTSKKEIIRKEIKNDKDDAVQERRELKQELKNERKEKGGRSNEGAVRKRSGK